MKFTDSVLSRLRLRLEEAPEEPRRVLAREVCRWLGWFFSDGKPKVSSCMKAFSILNKKKAINFPKIEKRYAFQTRKAHPQTLELPPIACKLSDAGSIELVVVGKKNSKSFKIWNEVMREFHYLHNINLCGSRIKYLIKSDKYGLLGALSFSSAQYSLADRDNYIGWTNIERLENLSRVISNSRFSILPNVKIENLCSKVLSMAEKQIADDWFAEYKVRPVLMETFVNSGCYKGTIYKAANWVQVGISAGRRDNQPKAIYLRPLEKKWKSILNKSTAKVTPNDPYKDGDDSWEKKELGRSNINDVRLRKRLYSIAESFYNNSTKPLTLATGTSTEYNAACRFFRNENVSMEIILESHQAETICRIKKEKIILAPQDTTFLNYTHQKGIREDFGPISTKLDGQIGMVMHDTLAFSTEGTPLGLLDVQCWRRDPELLGKSKDRRSLPIEEKESMKWLHSFRTVNEIAKLHTDTQFIVICDKEGDVFDFFYDCRNSTADLLVRYDKNRHRKMDDEDVIELMSKKEEYQIYDLPLPKRGNKKARIAKVKIKYHRGLLSPPKKRSKGFSPIELTVVQITEVGEPPKGEEPIDWCLLTTIDINSFEEAKVIVQYYAKRWGVEIYHKTIKSGCQIENRQTNAIEDLKAAIAIDLVIAWKIFFMTMISREKPNLPCTEILKEEEWKTIYLLRAKKLKIKYDINTIPTIKEAVTIIAVIGGYLNRKADPPPGVTVVWRGLEAINLAVEMYKKLTANLPPDSLNIV